MKKSVLLTTIIVCLFALATSSHATIISFDLDDSITGTPPQGDIPGLPWLRATFDDNFNGPTTPKDTVRLTMEALNLKGAERVDEWYFNLNPILALGDLKATFVPTTPPPDPFFIVGPIEVAGTGEYDFRFFFSLATPFNHGDEFIVDLWNIVGLNANSFNVTSDAIPPVGAPNDPRHTAALVVKPGVGNGGYRGHIGDNPNPVPEPATLLLLGVGLVGLAGFGRKKLIKYK